MVYDGGKYLSEDSYDDFDGSDYEAADYSAYSSAAGDSTGGSADEDEDSDGAPEEDAAESGLGQEDGEGSPVPDGDDEVYDFYRTMAKVDRGDVSRKRYARLAKAVKEGTEEEKKSAKEEACFYMKGMVRDFIAKKYRTYVEKDPRETLI